MRAGAYISFAYVFWRAVVTVCVRVSVCCTLFNCVRVVCCSVFHSVRV